MFSKGANSGAEPAASNGVGHNFLYFGMTLAHLANDRFLRPYWIVLAFAIVSLTLADAGARLALNHGLITSQQRDFFAVSSDRSFAEFVGYFCLTAALFLMLAAAQRLKDSKLLLWAGIIGYLLLDDALLIHDSAREWLAQKHFSNIPGLLAIDLGEMVFYGAAIVAFFAAIALAYRNASPLQIVHCGIALMPIATFGVIAVVLDSSISTLYHLNILGKIPHDFAERLEDIGEVTASGLIAMSALVLNRLGTGQARLPGVNPKH